MSCLRMRTCCGCLDTAKGTVLTAVACIAACAVTAVFIILGLVYWEPFSHAWRDHYNSTGLFSDDMIDISLKVLWWTNIFTLLFLIIYVILCVMLVMGVKKEQYKHMISWISLTTMLIPFVAISFLFQFVAGLIGGRMGILLPAILILVWCCIWLYGFFCAVSHYRMLKGDIHRPVATLFRKREI